VTHPGGDSLEPSIAAVVGSTNEFGGGYGAEFSVQPGRQEIISDLHHMVKVSGGLLIPKSLIVHEIEPMNGTCTPLGTFDQVCSA
jgi:hypothetical protein